MPGARRLLLLLLAAAAPKPDTAAKLQAAGTLACGVVSEAEDWSHDDPHGPMQKFDTEICRAVAAALLGDPAGARVKTYKSEEDALRALSNRDIDLAVGVTPGVTSAVARHLTFGPVLFWDQGGVLVRADAGATSLAKLSGKRVCFIDDTPMEQVLQAYDASMIRLPYQEEGEMEDALAGGSCQAIAADFSRLYAIKQRLAPLPLTVIAEPATLDPLAAAVRDDDPRFASIVAATVQALVLAEAAGVTAARAKTLQAGDDPDLQLLTGANWASAAALGLARNWPQRTIASVGNYGEIFARTTDMPRGVNALWLHGGLLAPLPLQ
jgi:general L-amino acid transport system substrate-binding protein